MGISQRIDLRQQQKLSMTPRLQQAIYVLQLSGAELEAYLEAETEKNPLLDLPLSNPRNDGATAQDFLVSYISMLEGLQQQIGMMTISPTLERLAKAMAGELDEDGYLRTPLFELADRLGAKTQDIETALKVLQSCEPAGIAGRNLEECLGLQLKAINRFDPIMEIVLQNLDLVASGNDESLTILTGETACSILEIKAEIKALNPRPGAGIGPDPVVDIMPEIEVKPGEMGIWHVELIQEALPKILINHKYYTEISAGGPEARQFAQQHLEAAHWLVKAMNQRATTILKVASAIVAHQYAWFEKGNIAMRPLTLAMIAEKVGCHESTVSRVTAGKYLLCRAGTYELKHFFTAQILALDRKTEFSALGIRTRIKYLIAQESHNNVFSDDRLVNILRESGVDIARRTVAKYREVMGIPSSVVRRKISPPAMVDNRHKRP
ncbi:MAG: RNA polymerase factor sigma-54 [Rhodobacteraceae bacterium]|nr:RNA polymerase factor sigma-54 [Paracoccaceae bacterium]